MGWSFKSFGAVTEKDQLVFFGLHLSMLETFQDMISSIQSVRSFNAVARLLCLTMM